MFIVSGYSLEKIHYLKVGQSYILILVQVYDLGRLPMDVGYYQDCTFINNGLVVRSLLIPIKYVRIHKHLV